MADDDKKQERLRKILGLETLPKDIKDFFKKNPDAAEELMGKQERDAKEFETIQKQAEVLLKIEKERMALTLDDPRPEVIEQITGLQDRMRSILQGGSDEELEQARKATSKIRIGGDDGIEMDEDQFLASIEDPTRAKAQFDSLVELGRGDLANKFAELIGDNLGERLTNQARSPLTRPTPEGERFASPEPTSPERIGGSASPTENIRRNIQQSLTQGTERTKELSGQLKSLRNRREI